MSASVTPPTPAPVHVDVVAIVVPPAVFYTLALITFSLRIIARWRATGLQLDDVFISLAMVCLLDFKIIGVLLTTATASSYSDAGLLCFISSLWSRQADLVSHNSPKINVGAHAHGSC
jgi:hypothetical protein